MLLSILLTGLLLLALVYKFSKREDSIGENFVLSLLQLQKERGRNFEVYKDRKTTKVFSKVADIQLILSERPDIFGRLERWKEPLSELGGVLFNEGATWKALRKPYEEVVSRQNLMQYEESFREAAERFMSSFCYPCSVDLFSFYTDLSLQLTTKVVFNSTLPLAQKDLLLASMTTVFELLPRPFEDYSAKGELMLAEYNTFKKLLQPYVQKAYIDSSSLGFHLTQMVDDPQNSDKLLYFFPINISFPMAAALTWMTVETLQHNLGERVLKGEEKLCEYILLETLRLHPTGPGITLTALENYSINGTYVNKGDSVYAFLQPTFRDENIFPNAQSFTPERWENPEAHRGYFAFGFGRRRCPGKLFATKAIQEVFVHIIKNYQVSLVQGVVKEVLGFITYPSAVVAEFVKK